MLEEPTETRTCSVAKSCKRVVGPYYSAAEANQAIAQHEAWGHLKKASPATSHPRIPDWMVDSE